MKKSLLLILPSLYLLFSQIGIAQNTVGVISNTEDSFDGFTLFSPRTSLTPRYTYLMNNCGEIVNQWESEFPLFSTDYLLEDASLFRSVINNQSTLDLPGNTGRIEHLDWEGDLIWGVTISETDFSFHHDYVVLDNGNIILLVAFRMSPEEAIALGRDPETIPNGELYEERLWEIEPVGADSFNIVWEWHSWDHLIQDFDSTQENFGVVSDHPELIDINFGVSFGEADWWHSNAISYNAERDQVLISNRNFDEFIIIDHSTTTEEAAGSTGGNSGMGGDILYRYGNPQSYDRGTEEDQVLSQMHNVSFIPPGSPDAGKILIFNNGPDFGFTAIQVIDPEFDETTNRYIISDGEAFGPDELTFEYTDPDNPSDFFASFLSSVQQLPNGNFLILNGPFGNLFEVTPESETVWEYQSPIGNSQTLSDGEDAANFQTRAFRALRYAPDFPAFEGRDLTPIGVLEQNPVEDNCELLLSIEENNVLSFSIFPNPADTTIAINSIATLVDYTIYDLSGKIILQGNTQTIDLSGLNSGLYIIEISDQNASSVQKFIKR